MPYRPLNADDPNDLLDRLRQVVPGTGWIVDAFGDRTGGGKALSLHAGDLFATFVSQLTSGGSNENPLPFLGVFGHTGHADGADPDVQADASTIAWTNYAQGPYTAVHLFAGTAVVPYLHLVIETQAGTFKHLGTGRLVTQGAVHTGQYAHGSAWYYAERYVDDPDSGAHALPFDDTRNSWLSATTQVRADYDAVAPRWHAPATSSNHSRHLLCGWRAANRPLSLLYRGGHSTLTGRAPGDPLWCAVPRGAGLWTDIGYPPDMRFLRLDSLAPGEELVFGTDRWKVFPVHRKHGPAGTPNSGVQGLAYRIPG